MKRFDRFMNWLYYSKGGIALGWVWFLLLIAELIVMVITHRQK